MEKIKGILEGIYSDELLRKTVIPLFVGNSGLGKTVQVQEFAKEKKINLIEVIGSTKMPHEVAGIAIPDKRTKKMTYYDYDLFVNLKDGDIIFLDELLNTNPMVLNSFLTLLENRTLPSGRKMPDVMIVAAANWQGSTPLTPQIKERFTFYDVVYSPTMYKKYLSENYGVSLTIFNTINSLISKENFDDDSKVNYSTPRSIKKALDMMIRGVETPYSDRLDCVNEIIENTTGEVIKIGEYQFMPNEKMPWIKLLQLKHKYETIKK